VLRVAEIGDRLATVDMDRKEGGLLGPHLTQCGRGRRIFPYLDLDQGREIKHSNRLAKIHQRYR